MEMLGVNTWKTNSVDQCVSTNNSSINNSSNTKIQFRNDGFASYHEKLFQKIEKKYATAVKENRRLCKTEGEIYAYIFDKYYNKNSPRYIQGLSKEERNACFSNELNLTFGRSASNCLDPVVRGDLIPESIHIARRNQYNRNQINMQIADLFAENEITVPKDVKLRFTIEPKEYKLTVNGMEDEELKYKIEKVLNTDENAKNLFYHMVNIQDDNAGQFSEKKLSKYYLNKTIKEETGYDLDELTLKDGVFYTKDGINIYALLMKQMETKEMPRDVKSSIHYYYREQLNEVAKYYNITEDLVLSIDYQNGSLYDVNQRKQYGVGQTQWINEMANEWSLYRYHNE